MGIQPTGFLKSYSTVPKEKQGGGGGGELEGQEGTGM